MTRIKLNKKLTLLILILNGAKKMNNLIENTSKTNNQDGKIALFRTLFFCDEITSLKKGRNAGYSVIWS
jgi:hypothetical protein